MKTKTPNNETVQSLRAKNYKVRISHQRLAWNKKVQLSYPLLIPQWIIKKNSDNWKIDNAGGVTIAQITSPEGKSGEGIAVCVEPNFDRRKGLQISIQRALAEIQ